MSALRVVDEHLTSPILVYSSSGGVFQNELTLVVEEGLTKEISSGSLIIRGFTFEDDLAVSLSGGRSFGRYASGETIPATGKTPAEVIQMAIAEPIDPTVSLTSPTSVAFNQTAINNVLNWSHTINTLRGTVSAASLQWRRGGAGAWTTLTNSLTGSGSYTHTLTDTNYNTQVFNYQYIVTDSAGATATASLDITPTSYVAPSISYTVVGNALRSFESNTKREVGNLSSNISGTVTRNTVNVSLTSYTIQYRVNGAGSWIDLTSDVAIGPGTSPIVSLTHNDAALKTSSNIAYRVKVVDAYQTHLSSAIYSSTTTVSFLKLIFYGPSAVNPTTSAHVRALGTLAFTDTTNPVTLNTGTIERRFVFAVPTGTSVTEVIDIDALNANITNNYILSTFDVEDFAGTITSYRVYTMTNAIAYSDNHRHRITRG
jgi:hypothetical protein